MTVTASTAAPVGHPDWYLHRHLERLSNEAPLFNERLSYYEGTVRLKAILAWWKELFGTHPVGLIDNLCNVVVDVRVERMKIEGFRYTGEGITPGELTTDAGAWRTWQWNDLDEFAVDATTDAMIHGRCPVLIGPPQKDGEPAFITVESPAAVAVDYVPGTHRQVAAATKWWVDPVAQRGFATVYLPGANYRYQTSSKITDGTLSEGASWVQGRDGQDWEQQTGVDFVPVVEIRNPRGLSDIDPCRAGQQALEKTFMDMLVASEFGAVPKRVLINTLPPQDKDGNELPNWQAEADWKKWLTLTPGPKGETPDVKQLDAAQLKNYTDAAAMQLQHFAARHRLPAYMFSGFTGNAAVNGEGARAAETGLISLVNLRKVAQGNGWERVVRYAAHMEGDDRRAGADLIETVWGDSEFQTAGEQVDSLLKLAALGVPKTALWERAGASQDEINRWKQAKPEDLVLDANSTFGKSDPKATHVGTAGAQTTEA
ncbi:MAG: phage portal protein [Solirubrobacteraceae bacterium]|nr:phage portal protein [Patulibacter sp.]